MSCDKKKSGRSGRLQSPASSRAKRAPVGESPEEQEYRFKIILLGNIDVGKTSLILRFTDATFSEEVAGEIDQKFKDLQINGKTVRLTIADTAGQERFRTLTSSFYRSADGTIVVYDVAETESFNDVEGHCNEANRYAGRSIKFLVANKTDLQAEVPQDDAKKLAEKLGIKFFETSAKTGENVQLLFETVARTLVEAFPDQLFNVNDPGLNSLALT